MKLFAMLQIFATIAVAQNAPLKNILIGGTDNQIRNGAVLLSNTGSTVDLRLGQVLLSGTAITTGTIPLSHLPIPVVSGNSGNILSNNGTTLTWSAPGANTALSNLASVAINTSLLPGTNNSFNVGSTTHAFSNVYVGSGGVRWNNGAYSITFSSGQLIASGGMRVGNIRIGNDDTIISRIGPGKISAGGFEVVRVLGRGTSTLIGGMVSVTPVGYGNGPGSGYGDEENDAIQYATQLTPIMVTRAGQDAGAYKAVPIASFIDDGVEVIFTNGNLTDTGTFHWMILAAP